MGQGRGECDAFCVWLGLGLYARDYTANLCGVKHDGTCAHDKEYKLDEEECPRKILGDCSAGGGEVGGEGDPLLARS